MLDFARLRNKEITLAEMTAGLTRDDLRRLTNEMVDTILTLIADCTDEDVTFVPDDPEAYDSAAATAGELNLPWTLGHVIVHTTASAEEYAVLAAEQGRGVEYHGRSRHEVYWESMTTIAQCRDRLEESRRMRLASLEMWPDHPYLNNLFESRSYGSFNAYGRFVLGLRHDNNHLEQISNIVRQTKLKKLEQDGSPMMAQIA